MSTKWNISFYKGQKNTELLCPTCCSGQLKILANKFYHEETAESRLSHHDAAFDHEWIRYRFSGVLKCQNATCGDLVSVLGWGNLDHCRYYNQQTDEMEEEFKQIFFPEYFHPTIKIFSIPKGCPSKISDEILKSFSLFWSDIESCANKIRVVVEHLLTHLGVNRFIRDGKLSPINLHQRIESLKDYKPELVDLFFAIKFIGNAGSHSTDILTKEDVIDAFALLEKVLNEIFDDKDKTVKKIAKEINKRRGPRSRKRPAF